MSKFHSGPNGPGKCSATEGRCPFGGDSGQENHFDSMQEAEKAFENSNADNAIPKLSKSSKKEKSKKVFNRSYSQEEINSIKERYPATVVLEPGKYVVFEEGEGAQYSTLDYDEKFVHSTYNVDKSKLDENSTDDEIVEYARRNNEDSDRLRFTRDRMNNNTDHLSVKNDGEYAHGYSMTQHYYNTESLKKEYPGMFNTKGDIDLPHVPSFEIKKDTPVINVMGESTSDDLLNYSIEREDEARAEGINFRFYIGDPDSEKGGFA